MRIRLTLGLTDRPGTLLRALERIAVNGGNIISIVHSRERLTGGYVPVSLSVEFPSHEHFERAKSGIEEAGIPVLSAESLERSIETVLIIGSIGVEKLERVFEGKGEVISLAYGGGRRSPYVRIVFSVNREERESLISSLEELAERNDCLLVREEV
ncbi:MAG: hypothetical protein RMJ28_00715 [Nitrososphaerota archaeon]|nr:hypothetical protein [Candidatus Calditenuaceae archaeon]MDW8072754.1 hypothetical protein [Nitrososphaerota archaeon]